MNRPLNIKDIKEIGAKRAYIYLVMHHSYTGKVEVDQVFGNLDAAQTYATTRPRRHVTTWEVKE